MPDRDGFEFAEELKKEDLLDGLPFLIVSAESERGGVTQLLKAGVKDYALKPVDLKILSEKIENFQFEER